MGVVPRSNSRKEGRGHCPGIPRSDPKVNGCGENMKMCWYPHILYYCLPVLPPMKSKWKSYNLWTLNPLLMLYVALFQGEDVQEILGQTREETS